MPGLGRLHIPDARDKSFPLRAAMAPAKKIKLPPSKSWDVHWIGNQGETSQCVAYAWTGFLRAQPLRRRVTSLPDIPSIYKGAQLNDQWPGESPTYEGSSVRGGAKFISDDLKLLSEYRWAQSMGDVIDWLATKGPIVWGTNWYSEMFRPDAHGFIKPEGPMEGGHAYLCYGYKMDKQGSGFLRFVNSWGRSWGVGGRFKISFEHAARLLSEAGEAAAALKLPSHR